jgi:hypothetical protein
VALLAVGELDPAGHRESEVVLPGAVSPLTEAAHLGAQAAALAGVQVAKEALEYRTAVTELEATREVALRVRAAAAQTDWQALGEAPARRMRATKPGPVRLNAPRPRRCAAPASVAGSLRWHRGARIHAP